MLRVLADNADGTLPFNYFAFFADRFYGRSYFHNYLHLSPGHGPGEPGRSLKNHSNQCFLENRAVIV